MKAWGNLLRLGKHKEVSFAFLHELKYASIGKSPETIVQSKGERDGVSRSGDLGLSTATVVACKASRMPRPLHIYSPTLNYIFLTEGGKPWNHVKIF